MQPAFRTLEEKIGYLTGGDRADIKRAFAFAEQAHSGQLREDGSPYLGHLLAVAEIVAGLQGVRNRLAQISAKWHKPILFIETGVLNARGFARYPWSHADEHPESPIDEQEQANFYEAMCQVFWNEPWFIGFTWWDWPAQISDAARSSAEPGTQRRTFSVNGKKAEEVLRTWYAKPAPAK